MESTYTQDLLLFITSPLKTPISLQAPESYNELLESITCIYKTDAFELEYQRSDIPYLIISKETYKAAVETCTTHELKLNCIIYGESVEINPEVDEEISPKLAIFMIVLALLAFYVGLRYLAPSGPDVIRSALGIYEGETYKGKPHGQGTFKSANGDVLSGNWKNGHLNGHGTYLWPDGDFYEGSFENGATHGKGVLLSVASGRYEGEFMNGKLHGKFRVVAINGEVREEEYEMGKKVG